MAFDGAEGLASAWARGLAPDPTLTVSEWADKHRMLTSRGANEPGPYRTARTPYLREIMDALSVGSGIETVVLMKSAQVGATEAMVNWIGYIVHHVPGPVLLVEADLGTLDKVAAQKIDPMIESTPAVRALIAPARSRDSGNTKRSKLFPGGVLTMVGANSATSLRSTPARFLPLDEVDGYPGDVDGEGDPVALAKARATTFGHRRKVFMASTPTIAGRSRIEREFETTDQRRYFVPCPHCGAMQWLKFDRLRWDKGRPRTAHYVCEHCEAEIEERSKTEMLAAGRWMPTAPEAQVERAVEARTVGFHISALYSPVGWMSWEEIARQWEAAQGNDSAIKSFKNTVLGEVWQESGDAPDWDRVYERREPYAAPVPAQCLFLTAGADVQKDRIEVYVWGWGRGLESWLVDKYTTSTGPDSDQAWVDLSAYLRRTWRHERGTEMGIVRACVDTGYAAMTVYAWARDEGSAVVAPVKGDHSWNRSSPVTGPTLVDVTDQGKRLRRGAKLWHVSVSSLKAETYRWLRLPRPTDEDEDEGFPPGTIHLPDWMDSETAQQLTAEQLVTTRNRKTGYARPEWQKLRERNEALDCRVYARAAAWMMGADRWSDDQWQALEDQLVPAPETPPPARRGERGGSGWLPQGRRGRWI